MSTEPATQSAQAVPPSTADMANSYFGFGCLDSCGYALKHGDGVQFCGETHTLTMKRWTDPDGFTHDRLEIGRSHRWLTPDTSKQCTLVKTS